MHATSFIALALGATAVSAASVQGRATYKYKQFPAAFDCPVENGKGLLRETIIDAVTNANRQGTPQEPSANWLSTKYCSNPSFEGIPLWTVSKSA